MSAKTIKINNETDFDKLKEAADALANGGLVAFPTETVYGLGGNALEESIVRKIYLAKGRPSDNPLIVHVSAKEDVYPLVESVPEEAEKILDTLCPGPITVILNKSKIVPDAVTAGGKTVAVRIPENKIARKLIELSGVPVAAPSANVSGRPSPTTASHVKEDLDEKIDYIIDGGACSVGIESTVIDLTVKPPRILRPGGVSQETLCSLLGEVIGYAPKDNDSEAPKSPGMKYRHYAPKAQMMVFEGSSCRNKIADCIKDNTDKRICVITAGKTDAYNCYTVNCGEEPEEYAKYLFDALRKADSIGADLIFAEFPFEHGGIATALRNRIYKSCGGNVILCT